MESYYRNGKVALEQRGYPQLYDHQLDPSESYNVAALHPDVMQDLMAQWESARREFEPIRTHPTTLTSRQPLRQD